MGATEELNVDFYFILVNLNENSHIWLMVTVLDSTGICVHLFPVWPKPVVFRYICLTGFLNAVLFAPNLPISCQFKNKNTHRGNKNHSWHMLSNYYIPCALLSPLTHLI